MMKPTDRIIAAVDPRPWTVRVFVRGSHGAAFGIDPYVCFAASREIAEQKGQEYAAEHARRLGLSLAIVTTTITEGW